VVSVVEKIFFCHKVWKTLSFTKTNKLNCTILCNLVSWSRLLGMVAYKYPIYYTYEHRLIKK